MTQALGKATSWGKHGFKSKPALEAEKDTTAYFRLGIVRSTRNFSARWITQTHSTSVG